MNNERNLILETVMRQLARLRNDTDAIAEIIAEECWYTLERELDEAESDGVADMDFLAMGYAGTLADEFHNKVKKYITNPFEEIGKKLEPIKPFDREVAITELRGAARMLHIQPKLEEMLGEAIEEAKPGFTRSIVSLLGDLLMEPGEMLQKDMKADGERVKKAVLRRSDAVRSYLASQAKTLLVSQRLAYEKLIDALMGSNDNKEETT